MGEETMNDIYREEVAVSEQYRAKYAEGLANAVTILQRHAEAKRHAFVTPETMAANLEWYRGKYKHMLGIDRAEEIFGHGPCETEAIPAGEDSLCRITNMLFSVTYGVCFYGLLLEPKTPAASPLPLAVFNHGGGGTPQLATDMWGENHYGGMARRLLAKGIAVYAPQMMKWPSNNRGEGFRACTTPNTQWKFDTAMRQCGVSIAGWEIYGVSRVLDTLLADGRFDAAHVGMTGLSYGGFYTLYTMAYDTRIRCGWSAAWFNDRVRYNWSDVVWQDSAAHFLDEEVAGLCAPRKLWIDVGEKDEVFDNTAIAPCFARTHEFFDAAGVGDNLVTNLHPGGHRFSEAEACDWFIKGITD